MWTTDERDAWLGPALEQMSDEQLEAFDDAARQIFDRYPATEDDPDAATEALSGALMSPRLDGEVVHQDTAFQVRAGQVLRFEFPVAGARTYLAVAGGIDVPLVLGSRSTYTLGALGGFHGRRLQEGDVLPIGETRGEGRAGNSLPMALRRSVGGDVTLGWCRGCITSG